MIIGTWWGASAPHFALATAAVGLSGIIAILARKASGALAVVAATLAIAIAHGYAVSTPAAATLLADLPPGAAGPWPVRGVLSSQPVAGTDSWSVDLAVSEVRIGGSWQPMPLRLRARVYDGRPEVAWHEGQGFEAFARITPARSAANPLLPASPPLRASAIDARTSFKSFRQLRRRPPGTVPALSILRTRLRRAADRHFGDYESLARALALGERGDLDGTLRAAMGRGGVAHLLAVSGLHVGVVIGAIFALLRMCGLPPPYAAVVSLAALPVFHGLVVPRPSVTRATLMAACVLLGVACGRKTRPENSLALATMFLAGADPWVTHDPGFQFSTAATAGIVATLPQRRATGLVGTVSSVVGVSAAAQLAVTPLAVASSFRLQPLAVLYNLAAVPIATSSIVTVWVTLVADALALDWLAALAGGAGRALLWMLERVADTVDGLSTTVSVAAPAVRPVTLVAVTMLAIAAVVRRRHAPAWRTVVVLGSGAPLCAAAALLVAGAGGAEPPALRLVAFDVGQGDALLLEAAAEAVVVDTGGSLTGTFDPGASILAPALRARGVSHLAAVATTHLHADHFGGLAGLLREFPASALWVSAIDVSSSAGRRFRAAARGLPIRSLAAGHVRRAGECIWRVLSPRPIDLVGSNAVATNDASLVLAVDCGGRQLLLTGDSEQDAEGGYAPQWRGVPGAVLKSPHHGSLTSSTEQLLDTVAPRHVVVSVGWRNRYGLPAAEILARYRRRGMAVYRTDRDGAITVTVGRRTRVRGERWKAGRAAPRVGGWLY